MKERDAGNGGPSRRLAADPTELHRLHILRGVSLSSIEDALAGCHVRQLEPGEVLLRQGQPNDVMYMVLAGRLSVHVDAPEGEAVAFVATGETVGEMSVMDASPASAFVVAAEPTRLLAVGESGFWQLVHDSHSFAVNLLVLLAQRLRANNTTVEENIRLRLESQRSATIDGLTGVFNRRWLDESLPAFVERAKRTGAPLTIVMLDIDHFKSFNDTYGHAAGDHVLMHVAATVRANLGSADLLARAGGEEFMIILPDVASADATVAAERLRAAVSASAPAGPDGTPLPVVTVSLGVACLRADDEAADLVAAADSALYAAKRGGRNRLAARPTDLDP